MYFSKHRNTVGLLLFTITHIQPSTIIFNPLLPSRISYPHLHNCIFKFQGCWIVSFNFIHILNVHFRTNSAEPDQMPSFNIRNKLLTSKFLKQGYLAVDLLFNVLPITCGSSVFIFVLLCITLCPFLFGNHLKEEEKAGCFAIIVLQM